MFVFGMWVYDTTAGLVIGFGFGLGLARLQEGDVLKVEHVASAGREIAGIVRIV